MANAVQQPINELLRRFAEFRGRDLRRRGRQNLQEVIDLLEEYFDEAGARTIDIRRDAPRSRARGVISIERAVDYLEDFEDAYLIRTIDAEREFIRRAEHIVRGFTRWIRGQATSTDAA